MEDQKFISKKKIIALIVIGVLIVICIVLGITYSFMRPINETSSITSVSLNSCANITLTDTGESIDLENTYPMSRNRALQTTPYTFTVSSTCETYVGFNLYLATLNTNTLSDSSIHYIVTERGSKEALAEGILSEATNALNEFEDYEIDQLNNGIGGTYGNIYNIFNDNIPLQGEVSYDLYLYIDGTVTNETMGQIFRTGVAVKSYEREPDPTSLALDISLGNIIINEGSTSNTLYVSGGGLSEQVEIDNTLPIVITGTTEEYGIEVYGGTSNITLNNVSIVGNFPNGAFSLNNESVVNLNIENSNELYYREDFGLLVQNNSILIIDGNGILDVSGYGGIGGNYINGISNGSIIINGGTINASAISTGGSSRAAAAIGGEFKLIEINGGNITAIGSTNYPTGSGQGTWGAGIGSSFCDFGGGDIIINGGTIYAKGGAGAAGIGSGSTHTDEHIGEACAYTGQITISDNANITAIAGPSIGSPAPENIGSAGGGG